LTETIGLGFDSFIKPLVPSTFRLTPQSPSPSKVATARVLHLNHHTIPPAIVDLSHYPMVESLAPKVFQFTRSSLQQIQASQVFCPF
jgi:hypothetical protein